VQGVIKEYDPPTRSGVVLGEPDRTAVHLRPGSLHGAIFRRLRPGQRIVCDVEEEAGRLYAVRVRVGSEGH
jgi:cold shock CspA family protein